MAIPVLKVSFGSIMRIYRDLTRKTNFTHADAIISFNKGQRKLKSPAYLFVKRRKNMRCLRLGLMLVL